MKLLVSESQTRGSNRAFAKRFISVILHLSIHAVRMKQPIVLELKIGHNLKVEIDTRICYEPKAV